VTCPRSGPDGGGDRDREQAGDGRGGPAGTKTEVNTAAMSVASSARPSQLPVSAAITGDPTA